MQSVPQNFPGLGWTRKPQLALDGKLSRVGLSLRRVSVGPSRVEAHTLPLSMIPSRIDKMLILLESGRMFGNGTPPYWKHD